MPKASRGRKKTKKIGTTQRRASQPAAQAAVASMSSASPVRGVSARRRGAPGTGGMQTLVFPAMVALGCWGMAFTLAYFYSDPNRLLFAGMAVLMALFWTYSLYIRIRKLRKTQV